MFSDSPTLYTTAGAFLFLAALIVWDLGEAVLKKYRWLVVLLAVAFLSAQVEAQTPRRLPDPDFVGYSVQVKVAKESKSPLVTFVNCKPRIITGCLVCQCAELPDYPESCIVVGTFQQGILAWKETLPPTATDEQIRAAFAGKAVSANLPVPFVVEPSLPPPSAVPDVDRPSPVGDYWIPPEFVEYQRARYTQSIFRLNDAPTIQMVPRELSERAWNVPGGMENLKGWSSRLFKYLPSPAQSWKAGIAVQNSFGDFQTEIGWHRSYPDGTVFLDVLSTDRGTFEVRKREKLDGQWYSLVEYRNRKARPDGYHGLKFSCHRCHDFPGQGGYATGLVAGFDTIFSDPMPFEPKS